MLDPGRCARCCAHPLRQATNTCWLGFVLGQCPPVPVPGPSPDVKPLLGVREQCPNCCEGLQNRWPQAGAIRRNLAARNQCEKLQALPRADLAQGRARRFAPNLLLRSEAVSILFRKRAEVYPAVLVARPDGRCSSFPTGGMKLAPAEQAAWKFPSLALRETRRPVS